MDVLGFSWSAEGRREEGLHLKGSADVVCSSLEARKGTSREGNKLERPVVARVVRFL